MVIRKYSLSNDDYDILTEEEINFSDEIDNIMRLYYKIHRYLNTFIKTMRNMLSNHDINEIISYNNKLLLICLLLKHFTIKVFKIYFTIKKLFI